MKQHIHLVGIGGSGLSSIARYLLESGCEVSGSDRVLSPLALNLAQAGARVFRGHAAEQIAGADVVVRSSAIPEDNPEIQAARAAGIPVLKRAEFLEQLLSDKEVIAVAGTHGKTTTTAMAAWVFTRLGLDPSFLVGGVVKNLGCNAHHGQSALFIIEADEYDYMFLGLSPRRMLLTVIEHDHPDCFPTVEDYHHAFRRFIRRLQPDGSLFACAEDGASMAILQSMGLQHQALTYGFSGCSAYQAVDVRPNLEGGLDFSVKCNHSTPAEVVAQASLRVPGMHNICNALSIFALVHSMGLDVNAASQALAQFTGAGRRFDQRGEAGGITVIDDYAHHPTEIRATLAAARLRYPGRRLWAVWQPHTFSRTLTLLDDFERAFGDADCVLVTEVYGAREADTKFSASQLVAQMSHPSASFAPTLQDAAVLLFDQLRPGDVLLVLSAGDADQISQQVLDHFWKMEDRHA